jgi:hypothetical protein
MKVQWEYFVDGSQLCNFLDAGTPAMLGREETEGTGSTFILALVFNKRSKKKEWFLECWNAWGFWFPDPFSAMDEADRMAVGGDDYCADYEANVACTDYGVIEVE